METFPDVHDIAQVSDRNDFVVLECQSDTWYQLVDICNHFVDPALRMADVRDFWVDFGADRYAARDVPGFGLCAGHAAQAAGDVHGAAQVVGSGPFVPVASDGTTLRLAPAESDIDGVSAIEFAVMGSIVDAIA